MKKYTLSLLFSLLGVSMLYAQIEGPKFSKDSTNIDENVIETTIKSTHVHQTKYQPKVFFGLGNFNFNGDITDDRNSSIISQTGYQIGLTSNLNDFFDATIYMQEGTLRIDGIDNDDLPKNFKSTISSVGFKVDYNFSNLITSKILSPYVGIGINYMKFDSKGSYDDTNDEYEVDLQDLWSLNPDNEEYSKNTIEIPLTLGLNFRINDRLNLKLSTNIYLTNTDYIDNIKNGSNDRYTVNSVGIVYDIFCKGCDDEYIPKSYDNYQSVDFDALDMEDNDRDGVKDIDDFCPYTPNGVKVDENGCAIDTDNDNVADYLDQEKDTPAGALVNSKGVQLSNTMGEMMYLKYIKSSNLNDAKNYYDSIYPSEKFVKIYKQVINKEGDTLNIELFKPKAFEEIRAQQRDYYNNITTTTPINLRFDTIFKIKIATHDKGIKAAEINRLMSIVDLKSTIVDDQTYYTSGEYKDLLVAKQKLDQFIISGYTNSEILEDVQGDLRTIDSDEIKRIQNKRASYKLSELPPIENIVFRVQLDVVEEVDLDFYDIEGLIVFEDNKGMQRVFSGGFYTYEEAQEDRVAKTYMGFDNAQVVAIKEGELVRAEDYMDLGRNTQEMTVFGDVIYKVMIGTMAYNDVNAFAEIEEIKGLTRDEIGNGIVRYTVGAFTNIQAAMMKQSLIEQKGYKGTYVIAFYNGEQISIEKAQELQK